jgi:DNA replication protein DnaC
VIPDSSAVALVAELNAARADDSYEAALKRFVKPELLIVDDLGHPGAEAVRAQRART